MQLELAELSSGGKWGLCDLVSTARSWAGFSCRGRLCAGLGGASVSTADGCGDSGAMRIKWDDMGPASGTQAICPGHS